MTGLKARIYTEARDVENIKALVGVAFDGFTIFDATGVWKGQEEQSVVIEILCLESFDSLQESFRRRVRATAKSIKKVNQQEAVLVTFEEIEGELI